MSADNWAVCPRCLKRARKAFEQQIAKISASYGVVPLEEFEASRAALEEPHKEDFYTFREDYEFFGAETGTVHTEYSGNCHVCHLSMTIDTKHEIPGIDE